MNGPLVNTVSFLRRVQRRALIASLITWAGKGATCGLLAGGLGMTVMRCLAVSGEHDGWVWWGIAGAGLGLAGGAAWAMAQRWPLARAAHEADLHYKTRDALASALELSQRGENPFHLLAAADAERRAAGLRAEPVVPIVPAWNRGWWWWMPFAACAVIGAGLWFPALGWNKPSRARAAVREEAPVAAQSVKDVAQSAAALAAQTPDLSRAQIEQLKQLEAELAHSGSGPVSPALRDRVANATEQIADKIEKRSEQTATADDALRKELGERLRYKKDDESTLSKALRSGDLEGAARAAEEIAQAAKSLPPEERKKLAEQLDRLASSLGENKGARGDGESRGAANGGARNEAQDSGKGAGAGEEAKPSASTDRAQTERDGKAIGSSEKSPDEASARQENKTGADVAQLREAAKAAADELRQEPEPPHAAHDEPPDNASEQGTENAQKPARGEASEKQRGNRSKTPDQERAARNEKHNSPRETGDSEGNRGATDSADKREERSAAADAKDRAQSAKSGENEKETSPSGEPRKNERDTTGDAKGTASKTPAEQVQPTNPSPESQPDKGEENVDKKDSGAAGDSSRKSPTSTPNAPSNPPKALSEQKDDASRQSGEKKLDSKTLGSDSRSPRTGGQAKPNAAQKQGGKDSQGIREGQPGSEASKSGDDKVQAAQSEKQAAKPDGKGTAKSDGTKAERTANDAGSPDAAQGGEQAKPEAAANKSEDKANTKPGDKPDGKAGDAANEKSSGRTGEKAENKPQLQPGAKPGDKPGDARNAKSNAGEQSGAAAKPGTESDSQSPTGQPGKPGASSEKPDRQGKPPGENGASPGAKSDEKSGEPRTGATPGSKQDGVGDKRDGPADQRSAADAKATESKSGKEPAAEQNGNQNQTGKDTSGAGAKPEDKSAPKREPREKGNGAERESEKPTIPEANPKAAPGEPSLRPDAQKDSAKPSTGTPPTGVPKPDGTQTPDSTASKAAGDTPSAPPSAPAPDTPKPQRGDSETKQAQPKDGDGIGRMAEVLKEMAKRGQSAKDLMQQSQGLREKAQKLLDSATPEQRRELEKLARELTKDGQFPPMNQDKNGDRQPGDKPDGGEKPSPGETSMMQDLAGKQRDGKGENPGLPGSGDGRRAGASPRGDSRTFSGPVQMPRSTKALDEMEAAKKEVVDARSGGKAGKSEGERVIAEWDAPPKPGDGGKGTNPGVGEGVRRAAEGAERAIEQQSVPPQYSDLVRRVFRKYVQRTEGDEKSGPK